MYSSKPIRLQITFRVSDKYIYYIYIHIYLYIYLYTYIYIYIKRERERERESRCCCSNCDCCMHICCNNISKQKSRRLKKDSALWYCKSYLKREIPFSDLNDTEFAAFASGMCILPNKKMHEPTIFDNEFRPFNIYICIYI